MKQYLFKGIDGEYRVVDHDCQGRAVEIPEGVNYAYYSAKEGKPVFTVMDTAYFYGGALWQRHTATLEYLNPSGWSLHVINPENDAVPADWVLVPEGANFYCDKYFWKNINSREFWNCKDWQCNQETLIEYMVNYDLRILWSRNTNPEPLPFIDDEPVAHNHYFKDVSKLESIDVYQVLKLFGVIDPCLQHIVKKALCAGKRGHKDFERDLQDIFDTAKRALEINIID